MGEIAETYSYYMIITNDNQRFEDAKKIAFDITKGIKGENYEILLDRSSAIKKAFMLANKNDVIVIAGKGAENQRQLPQPEGQ